MKFHRKYPTRRKPRSRLSLIGEARFVQSEFSSFRCIRNGGEGTLCGRTPWEMSYEDTRLRPRHYACGACKKEAERIGIIIEE